VWHRYRPDPQTGWHEQWIELRGPALQRLERAGLIRDRDPVVDVTPDGGAIESLFHRILEAVRASGPRPEPLAAAWAMEILARLQAPRERLGLPAPIARAVHRAEAQLAENSGRPLPLRKLARELGFAYSYFRREFKASTGVSPGQYARRLRLERARRLLGSAPDSVKSIADQLGFSSEFHFSAAFKRTFGVSPAKWRAEARRAAIARRGESASAGARPG
jgi:AraC-like DNA-binding protein